MRLFSEEIYIIEMVVLRVEFVMQPNNLKGSSEVGPEYYVSTVGLGPTLSTTPRHISLGIAVESPRVHDLTSMIPNRFLLLLNHLLLQGFDIKHARCSSLFPPFARDCRGSSMGTATADVAIVSQ